MRRRTLILWKRLLTRFAILLFIFGIFYVYFFTGFFTLQRYDLTGIPDGYVLDLKKNMAQLAEQKIYYILPGNRAISYHDSAIRALIMDTLPNTKDISIHSTGLHSLAVKVQSYTPIFSVGKGYAISDDATVYKEIIPLDQYAELQIASTTAVTPSTLRAISTLSQKISAVLFKIGFISIDEYGDIKFYNESKSSYVAIASASDETKVWSNILSAIDTDPLKKSLAANVSGLEYIDARFGNKIFYKFTNGAKPVIIPNTNDHASSTSSVIQ